MSDPTSHPRPLRMLAATAAVARSVWLVIGASLLLLGILEASYRLQGKLRRAWAGQEMAARALPELHPYADSSWWQQWQRDDVYAMLRTRFDPYRGWWPVPVVHPLIHVDSMGLRRTVPAPDPASQTTILLLGGSTMWGYTARDEHTIPSLMASSLRESHPHISVVNMAQPGFTATQELATLILELRGGRVPRAVVLLDGNNDIATAFQSGTPGRVLNEHLFAERQSRPVGLAHAIEDLASGLQLVQRLDRFFSNEEAAPPPAPEEVCPDLASQYASLARVLDGLAQEFGFVGLLVFQPLRATSGKVLTDWERGLGSPDGWVEFQRRCAEMVDLAMAGRLGDSYFSLQGLFDDEKGTVFMDEYGHLTEAANRRVADMLTVLVLEKLSQTAR